MSYIVNFVLILLKNTPPLLRLNPFRAFMEIFGRGLNAINKEYVYTISHTGQVASLEHYLNGKYLVPYSLPTRSSDINNNLIIWIDGPFVNRTFVYNKFELKVPLWLYNKSENSPVYLHNQSEVNAYEFVIRVPATLPYNESQLRAHADKYVIAGKRYIVQTY